MRRAPGRWYASISTPRESQPVKSAAALLAATAACTLAHAQQGAPVPLDTVVVSATRESVRTFDAPAAITAVHADAIREAGPQVNLSEALDRVPGLTVLNRQNYAQDLQLSIRGFGSRSTFGIRGVRLVVDGIPATMPDGQGQASTVSLPSAARIEVLRGPLALLYGNAAGGVVQVFTRAGAERPTLAASATASGYDAHRYGASFAATSGAHRYIVDLSRFSTDGYRPHSAARREQLNAKWTADWSADTRIDTVVNVFDQPLALDPLGLTREQWEADPRQTQAIALAQDPRKSVRQAQVGVVASHRIDRATRLDARVYGGTRDLDNALPIPLAAQAGPTSSGGIVSFDRRYAGAGLQLSRRFALGGGNALRLLAGVDRDRMADDRQGYVNDGGEPGALKRDETDRADNTDLLVQASADLGERWSAIAGVRTSRVDFEVDDRYVAPGNPDDSGRLSYRATNPVAGITWHATPRLNVYANAGRGFETPTFTELFYRNGASGINTDLRAARSRDVEIGAKWRGTRHALDVAAYDIRTQDDLVVDTNTGGRSTFRNAGRTRRRGVEVWYTGAWGEAWRATVSYTALRARFDEGFETGSGTSARAIPAGNRLPGTPERSAFAELAFAPPGAWGGFHAAVEVVHTGSIAVNDANDDFAPAATVVNLRAAWRVRVAGLVVEPLVRVDNATDRRYAGSVIVNDGNRRYFEPALPRTWTFALSARHAF